MPVRVAAFVLAAALTVAGGASAGGGTSLTIKVMPNGAKPAVFKRYALRCEPAGGTLPQPRAACDQLAQISAPFAPVPRDIACTQIYGGANRALVTGTYRGSSVWVIFRRNDGCQIHRWDRVKFLFPA